jgi:opacity protein-like surface antigen
VKKIFCVLAISLFCQQFTATAQRGWEIGGWAGVSHYFGDLNTKFDLTHPGFAGGTAFRFNFNDRLCLKMSANYGTIGADDKYSSNVFEQRRNLNFRSVLIDGTGQFEFNFMPYNYFDKSQWFSPYLFGGLSVYHFNPQGKLNGTTYDLRPLGTEGQFRGEEYYTTQMAFAYGGGLKIALSEVWSINIELSARKLFTDYLDDVSKTYPNMNEIRKQHGEFAVALSDPSIPDAEGKKIGQFGRQRGDSKSNDSFTFFGIGVLYYFGELRCPPLSNR